MNSAGFHNAAGQANHQTLPEGAELGDYRIVRLLGQGGFGITYQAEQISTGHQVVIKENLPSFCAFRHSTSLVVGASNPADPLQEYSKYLRDFVTEARLLASLNHPNIVRVKEAFEALGTAYYVMPWVGGRELGAVAPAAGEITEKWLQPILRQLLSALEYLHERNIYHRDVKPGNILMTDEGVPVIIDFGTARNIISERSATMVGSSGYAPVEQITAHGHRGPWSDVYSLGATCYRLITGAHLPDSLMRLAAEDDPVTPLCGRSELEGRFSVEFLKTVDRAFELRARNRWQSATEWLSALPELPTQPERIVRSIATSPIVMHEPAEEKSAEVETEAEAVAETQAIESEQDTADDSAQAAEPPLPQGKRPRSRGRGVAFALLLVVGCGYAVERVNYLNLKNEVDRLETAQSTAATKLEEKNKAVSEMEGRLSTIHSQVQAVERENKALEEENIQLARRDLERRGFVPSRYNEIVLYDNCAYYTRLLIYSGADLNAASENGATLLQAASAVGQSDVVKLLLTCSSVDINKADNNGLTPLFLAATYGHVDEIRQLLDAPGIDVNKKTNLGATPLMSAVYNGYAEVVSLLLSHPSVNVNLQDANGTTALGLAALCGRAGMIARLQAVRGIDINRQDSTGATPLYVAAAGGHVEAVRTLLAASGIDINKADNAGVTPMKAAEEAGHAECARLIQEAGGR